MWWFLSKLWRGGQSRGGKSLDGRIGERLLTQLYDVCGGGSGLVFPWDFVYDGWWLLDRGEWGAGACDVSGDGSGVRVGL